MGSNGCDWFGWIGTDRMDVIGSMDMIGSDWMNGIRCDRIVLDGWDEIG